MLNACCMPRSDGMSWVLREIGGYLDLDSDCARELLSDVFSQTPLTNIITENRFARHRQQTRGHNGHGVVASTHATNHVLSEFRSMWSDAKAAHLHRTGVRYELIEEFLAKSQGRYRQFISDSTKGVQVFHVVMFCISFETS